jgi:hypothetical protein
MASIEPAGGIIDSVASLLVIFHGFQIIDWWGVSHRLFIIVPEAIDALGHAVLLATAPALFNG